jgi:hypothetical protein
MIGNFFKMAFGRGQGPSSDRPPFRKEGANYELGGIVEAMSSISPCIYTPDHSWFPSSAWEPTTSEALLRNPRVRKRRPGEIVLMARITKKQELLILAFPRRAWERGFKMTFFNVPPRKQL